MRILCKFIILFSFSLNLCAMDQDLMKGRYNEAVVAALKKSRPVDYAKKVKTEISVRLPDDLMTLGLLAKVWKEEEFHTIFIGLRNVVLLLLEEDYYQAQHLLHRDILSCDNAFKIDSTGVVLRYIEVLIGLDGILDFLESSASAKKDFENASNCLNMKIIIKDLNQRDIAAAKRRYSVMEKAKLDKVMSYYLSRIKKLLDVTN